MRSHLSGYLSGGRSMSRCPISYHLCDRTVTIYRLQQDTVTRYVADNCYFSYQDQMSADTLGRRVERPFLLIMPGDTQRVFPGDRVYEGIGPEISAQNWREFIPAKVEKVCEVAYVIPYYWQGTLCHVEAGRK